MSAQEAPVGSTAGTSFAWNTRGQVIAAATVLPALALIGVALRVWSRCHKRNGFGFDDAFIIPALVCVIGLGVALLVGVAKEVIAHPTPPNPFAGNPEAQLYQNTPQQELVEKIEFISFLLTVVAYGCIKLSVLFFYRRLFVNGTSKNRDVVTKVAIGITAAWTMTFFLLQLFMCGRHIAWNWGPFIVLETCVDGFKYNNALFTSDLITDILVICLPIPYVDYPICSDIDGILADYSQILKLHMTIQRKVATIGVLLLGTISIVAALIRLVFSFQAQAAGDALPTDVDEGITTLLYWGMLEAGISLIATNLPSIYFLIRSESLQSFANSIRSRVSINSLRSQQSNSDTGDQALYSKQQNRSKASNVSAARGDWEGVEDATSFVMYDMKRTRTEGLKEPEAVHATGGRGKQGDMV